MKAIRETVALLRDERKAVQARLDALDLALENLQRAFDLTAPAPTRAPKRRVGKRPARRRSKPVRKSAPSPDPTRPIVVSEATQRREAVLALLAKAPHGLTIGDLHKQLPKVDPKDCQNSLQALRMVGKIRRAGNVWQVAA